MKAYRISGVMTAGKKWPVRQPFNWEAAAADPEEARIVAIREIGSKHAVPANKIEISGIKEIKKDEVTSARVAARLAAPKKAKAGAKAKTGGKAKAGAKKKKE